MSNRLENIVRAMPSELEDEAAALLETWLARRTGPGRGRKSSLSWVGALSHLKGQYRSGVDAAHAAASEWADDVDRKHPAR